MEQLLVQEAQEKELEQMEMDMESLAIQNQAIIPHHILIITVILEQFIQKVLLVYVG